MAALLDGQDKGIGGLPLPDAPAAGPASNRWFRKWTRLGLLLLLFASVLYGTVAGLRKGKRMAAQTRQEKATYKVLKNENPIQEAQALEKGQNEPKNSISNAGPSRDTPETGPKYETTEHKSTVFPVQPANQGSSNGAFASSSSPRGSPPAWPTLWFWRPAFAASATSRPPRQQRRCGSSSSSSNPPPAPS